MLVLISRSFEDAIFVKDPFRSWFVYQAERLRTQNAYISSERHRPVVSTDFVRSDVQ